MTLTPRRTPLLSFSGLEMRSVTSAFKFNATSIPHRADSDTPQKPWHHYIPLCGTFVLLFYYMTFN
jgi:palmitoyltransferase ZDHHC2/15/20